MGGMGPEIRPYGMRVEEREVLMEMRMLRVELREHARILAAKEILRMGSLFTEPQKELAVNVLAKLVAELS